MPEVFPAERLAPPPPSPRACCSPSDSVVWLWNAPRRSPSSTSLRDLALLGRLDLAQPLAQLRRNEGEAQRREKRLLVGRRHALAAARLVLGRALPRRRDQAPLAQAQAPVEGALAHLHVVVLRAREMMQGEGELVRRGRSAGRPAGRPRSRTLALVSPLAVTSVTPGLRREPVDDGRRRPWPRR